jgi:probable rRNA maturation factor
VTQSTAPVVASQSPQLDAEIVIEDDRWCDDPVLVPAAEAAVAALARLRLTALQAHSAATVLLSDDAHVMRLNADFRGKPVPTNVLSFPSPPQAFAAGTTRYLGDVIIARETVQREAKDLAISVAHHLQHLTIHGLLHLLGYDHQTDADAAVMETLETRVLASLGVADPYA